MSDTIKFNSSNLESSLSTFASQGITEFTLQDEAILSHKGKLLHFLEAFREKAGNVILTLPVNASLLDRMCARLVLSFTALWRFPLKDQARAAPIFLTKNSFPAGRRCSILWGLSSAST